MNGSGDFHWDSHVVKEWWGTIFPGFYFILILQELEHCSCSGTKGPFKLLRPTVRLQYPGTASRQQFLLATAEAGFRLEVSRWRPPPAPVQSSASCHCPRRSLSRLCSSSHFRTGCTSGMQSWGSVSKHFYINNQCCGSMTFWRGSRSGSTDPFLWLVDPDSDSDPAFFVIDLQDANKELI
jgi:hypothetical protein